jgi:hypothetical protein
MDNAAPVRVRVREGLGELGPGTHNFRWEEGAAAIESVRQGATGQVLHDNILRAAGLAAGIDADDIVMPEVRDE